MKPPIDKVGTCFLLGVLAMGCGESMSSEPVPPTLEPPLPGADPSELGPYGIGVTTFETTDGEEGGRTLPVEVWYPTTATSSAPSRYAIMAGDFTLVELDSPNGAIRDGALDYRGAPHPVVAFSHGYSGLRIQSVYLCEWLASHGFVVVSPDHIGNTFTAGGTPAIESARVRPTDISRSIDGLLERTDGFPDELLAFAADPARIGMAGHSFGGFTTFRVAGGTIDVSQGDVVCAEDPDQLICEGWPPEKGFPESDHDPRIIAAMPQAPGGAIVFQGSGYEAIDIPVLIQAGDLDDTTPYDEEAIAPFEALTTDAHLLTIAGAGHFTFSDMCLLVDELGLSISQIEDGCAEQNIPYVDAHRIINRYATAFFKLHVAGDDSYDYAKVLESAEAPATIISN